MTINVETLSNSVRSCGTCTECCKGWLFGTAHDKPFYSGHPCHFLGKNCCTIYENRPEDPCQTYYCGWIKNDLFPEWLKPELSKVILTLRSWGENDENVYIEVLECGQKIDASVLNWLFLDFLNHNRCYKIQVDGGWNNYGTPEFIEWTNKE